MRALLAFAALASITACRSAHADDDWTAKLVARADQISTKAAKLRGLAVIKPIAKGVMTDAQLRARIVESMDQDSTPAERAAETAMAKRWGLIPMRTDLEALMIDLLTEQIAGFYDPKEGKLYVSAKPATDDNWADMIMAHELTHALQDQHFGLEKWMAAVKDNADSSAARQALVEGDGVALMIEYLLAEQGMGPPWEHDEIVRLMTGTMDAAVAGGDAHATAGAEQLAAAPLAVREGMIFPYQAGVGFVAALRRGQTWGTVDAAYARPPVSTEQILHPALYLAGEQPDVITAPPGALHTGVWGEEGWRVFLRAHGVGAEKAASAAAGWGGDRVILTGGPQAIASPGRATGVAMTTWDAPVDALEFWGALSSALDGLAVGSQVIAEPQRMVWLEIDGRVTAAELRDRQVAIVTGASALGWPTALADAWTWKIAWGDRPAAKPAALAQPAAAAKPAKPARATKAKARR